MTIDRATNATTGRTGIRARCPKASPELILLLIAILLFGPGLFTTMWIISGAGDPWPRPQTFRGPSTELKRTVIVPTLDTPMPANNNVIWCASFTAVWKELARFAGEDELTLTPGSATADRLNVEIDPASYLPPEDFYTAAGRANEGIADRIQSEMVRRFGDAAAPELPPMSADGVLAFAYVQAEAPFPIPYFDCERPIPFRDSEGNTTELRCFGFNQAQSRPSANPHGQLEMLYVGLDDSMFMTAFAIDLCRDSTPNQIIIADIEPTATLAETVEAIEQRIKAWPPNAAEKMHLRANSLAVPEIAWRVVHRLRELEGQVFTNPELAGLPLTRAEQMIDFRLDRSGAKLKSQSVIVPLAAALDFYLYRPFLLYMKRRDADQPFFVMWVDNAELLRKW